MSDDKPFIADNAYREALRKPFPPAQIGRLPRRTKTGGTIHLDYVSHAVVTDRLNEVAPDWSYTIDRIEVADGHVVGILGTMTIGGKSLPEAGTPDRPDCFGEEMKLAISDFIRRGAMRFGVGLALWAKEELSGDREPAPAQQRPEPPAEPAAPPAPGGDTLGGCVVCGQVVTQARAVLSQRKYGKIICLDCEVKKGP